MSDLKKKVFWLAFSILSISIVGFIVVFNTEKYLEYQKNIKDNLRMARTNEEDKNKMNSKGNNDNQGDNVIFEDKDNPGDKPLDDISSNADIKYMDKVVYTILLDNDNSIRDVINLSNNNMDDSGIKVLGQSILDNDKIKDEYVGNLYFNRYSYVYSSGRYLTIIDNKSIQNSLYNSLLISVVLLLILEIIVYLVSMVLTNWIIKPVISSFEKQKEFIADASHELKTPLSVIIASSEALEDNPKEVKWLNNIKNEANRMSILIKNLLELASLEKKETFVLKEDNLSKVVELAVLTFDAKAYEENVKLESDIEENIKFSFDGYSMNELVEILLDNALKHADKKSTIEVELKSEGNNIVLRVKDTGDIIPAGEEEKIFERFYRLDKSRNRKDNRYGLGLAIAKNIVLNHNGKISARSTGNVTVFEVLFKK